MTELILHVSEIQVEDMAPRDTPTHVLRGKFCPVGGIISPYLTAHTDFESTKFSKNGKKTIAEKDGVTQTVCGQIIDGYFDYISGFKLVVDAGVLMRVSVKSPYKIDKVRDEYGGAKLMKAGKKLDQLIEFVVSKGDYLTFSGVIEGMWLDFWESAITITNQSGTVVSRRELPNKSLILKVKYGDNPNRSYKLDDYYSRFKHVQRFVGEPLSIKFRY